MNTHCIAGCIAARDLHWPFTGISRLHYGKNGCIDASSDVLLYSARVKSI